jgi:endogenous inhibitor of DNA gyrase (YacG/DUF329 family)
MPPPSDPKPPAAAKAAKEAATEARKAAKAKRCPICGQPATEASHPFCSPRCRDVDLNRWLSGTYVIPARDDEPDDVD